MKPSEILREAVKLEWTQGAFARTAGGLEVDFDDPKASCFCSIGRIRRTADTLITSSKAQLYLRSVVGNPVPDWNDAFERTREQVDAAFLDAAKLAEMDGQ